MSRPDPGRLRQRSATLARELAELEVKATNANRFLLAQALDAASRQIKAGIGGEVDLGWRDAPPSRKGN